MEGYAYILTHQVIPAVFYDHFYDWGDSTHDQIVELVQYLINGSFFCRQIYLELVQNMIRLLADVVRRMLIVYLFFYNIKDLTVILLVLVLDSRIASTSLRCILPRPQGVTKIGHFAFAHHLHLHIDYAKSSF